MFRELGAVNFMFVAIESKVQRHCDLGFRTKYYSIRCLTSGVVYTRVVSKSDFR